MTATANLQSASMTIAAGVSLTYGWWIHSLSACTNTRKQACTSSPLCAYLNSISRSPRKSCSKTFSHWPQTSMMDAVLARSQIGVEEYLDLVFNDRPEPDYVDGEVVERALPTPVHSQIQGLLIVLFAPLMIRFLLVLLPELRMRVEPRRFRVVDLAVYRESRPEGRYAASPAYVAIEIVSPDD